MFSGERTEYSMGQNLVHRGEEQEEGRKQVERMELWGNNGALGVSLLKEHGFHFMKK
jgi:hypothetical protein